MKRKKKEIFLRRFYTVLFFLGLFLGFSIGGAVDMTEAGSVSCAGLIITGCFSVLLMLPLVIWIVRSDAWYL